MQLRWERHAASGQRRAVGAWARVRRGRLQRRQVMLSGLNCPGKPEAVAWDVGDGIGEVRRPTTC